jgi:hypothetical protein
MKPRFHHIVNALLLAPLVVLAQTKTKRKGQAYFGVSWRG